MARAMAEGAPVGEHKLPRRLKEAGFCVVRKVGNQHAKHKDFRVRRARVLGALQWLKANNPYYADIEIDPEALNALPEDGNAELPTASELGVMEPEPEGPAESGHKVSAPDPGTLTPELAAEYEQQDQESAAPSSGAMGGVSRCRPTVADERALNEVRGVPDEGDAYRRPEDPIAFPEQDDSEVSETMRGFMSMAYPHLFPWGEQKKSGQGNRHNYGADYVSDNRFKKLTKFEYFQHLLHYKDQRFARDEIFRYEAFSQIHRERARSSAKAKTPAPAPAPALDGTILAAADDRLEQVDQLHHHLLGRLHAERTVPGGKRRAAGGGRRVAGGWL